MTRHVSTRRDLLKGGAVAAVAAGTAAPAFARQADSPAAAEAADQAVSPDTLNCAEALFDIRYTEDERAQAVLEIDEWIARTAQQRAVEKPNTLAPACMFDPRLPGTVYRPQTGGLNLSGTPAGPLPGDETGIAFAPVWKQAAWVRAGALSSRRLTEIYLDRIARYNGRLNAFVTVTPEIARAQADHCDRALAEGRLMGPLHGIPYGMKDIIDVAGVAATWGATPWRERVAERLQVIVRAERRHRRERGEVEAGEVVGLDVEQARDRAGPRAERLRHPTPGRGRREGVEASAHANFPPGERLTTSTFVSATSTSAPM